MIGLAEQDKIASFWSNFSESEWYYYKQLQAKDPEWLFEYMEKIFPWEDDLDYKFWRNQDTKKISMIITPNWRKTYFELTYAIVQWAPALNYFEPIAFMPKTYTWSLHCTNLKWEEYIVDDSNLRIMCHHDFDEKKIHVELYTTDGDNYDDIQKYEYDLISEALWEYDTELYIGGIRLIYVESIDWLQKLDDLSEIVDEFKKSLE